MSRDEETVRTLDELESRRRKAEAEVDEALRRARDDLESFAAQVESAHGLLEEMREQDAGLAAEEDGPEPPPVPHVRFRTRPEGEGADAALPRPGGVRGLLGGLTDRLLGGIVARLEAQQRARWERLENLAGQVAAAAERAESWHRRLERRDAALRRALERGARQRRDALTACVAALLHAVEAQATVMGVHQSLLTLEDARSAETVRRAVAPGDRRVEAALEELSRRQEALLADLVGRRRHLEELLEELQG